MTRPLAVLRPEPGNAATARAIEAAGARALRLPLFAVDPLAWTPPDPAAHDALVLTSANAVRQAGPALQALAGLPVHAVGAATAAAARAAGLTVVATGTGDAAALMADVGVTRGLRLAGRDRAIAVLPGVTRTLSVYASEPIALPADELARLRGSVALLHSPRAAIRLAELVVDRGDIAVATLSAAVAAAAGPGWQAIAVAPVPTDAALIASALPLAGYPASPD